jgi:hypothetical protein
LAALANGLGNAGTGADIRSWATSEADSLAQYVDALNKLPPEVKPFAAQLAASLRQASSRARSNEVDLIGLFPLGTFPGANAYSDLATASGSGKQPL